MIFTLSSILHPLTSLCRPQPNELTVGFYNLENMFDTINAPSKSDGDYTPEGVYRWNSQQYDLKRNNLSSAISLFMPDILGVCEAENEKVLQDIISCPSTRKVPYAVVHYHSDDPRGMDVGLVYRTDRIRILASEPIKPDDNRPTRDILRVELMAQGVELLVIVAHLPSKRNNDKAATRQRQSIVKQIDTLTRQALSEKPGRGVIVCGDFNDNPNSRQMRTSLTTLHNTSLQPFTRGKGSYVYHDTYQMFDQILISHNMLKGTAWIAVGHQNILHHRSLIQQNGRFADYPAKGTISDHLPVYLKFAKNQK